MSSYIQQSWLCEPSRFGMEVDPYNLCYYSWGDASAKTVLCLHGITGNGRHFDYIAKDLVDKGYHVLCPDMPGRGVSDALSHPKQYGYPLYVMSVVQMLESLELGSVDIVGTSMGGLMGMMLATMHPGKIGRMVINDIGPYIEADALNRLMGNLAVQTHFEDEEQLRAYFRRYLKSFGVYDPSEYFEHMIDVTSYGNEEDGYDLAFDPKIMVPFKMASGRLKTLPSIDLWHIWEAVEAPCLVLRGEESALFTVECLEKMMQKPEVESVTFNGVGHAPMLMEPLQRDVVTQWLTAVKSV